MAEKEAVALGSNDLLGVTLYPEMNRKVVELLRLNGGPTEAYAAARIEQLEARLASVMGKCPSPPPGWDDSPADAQRHKFDKDGFCVFCGNTAA